MLRSVVFVACLLGCSGDGPDEPPRGPDVTALPAGSGWGCFRDSVSDVAYCTRPADCETARRRLRDEYDRRALSYSISPCAERNGASCLTMKPATAPAAGWLCYEMASECEEARAFYAAHPADYTQVSGRCGTYP